MRITRLVALGTAVLLVGGCADGRTGLDPTAPALASASSSRQVEVSGAYVASLTSIQMTSKGPHCLLEVEGSLTFTGDIVGTATGTTTALVFATCEDVIREGPGRHPDVFQSRLVFEGTVDGEPATANVLYAGRVQAGGLGQIEGRLIFSNGVSGRLEVDDAVVGAGGTYHGSVVVH